MNCTHQKPHLLARSNAPRCARLAFGKPGRLGLKVLAWAAGLSSSAMLLAAPSGERLKNIAPPSFHIGGVLHGYSSSWNDLAYRQIAQDEFNVVTATAYQAWNGETTRDVYNYTGMDNVVNWAGPLGMPVHGHVLVYPWANQNLSWYQNLPLNEVEGEMYEYIDAFCTRYAGRVWVWDVVNESFADWSGEANIDANGLRKGYKEYQAMGADYIRKAFTRARQKDPSAILIYNDYGAEQINWKSDKIYAFVQALQSQGVPIDGVGFQFHLDAKSPPNYQSIRDNLQRFANLGLRIYITELDVKAKSSTNINSPPTAAEETAQKAVFKEAVRIGLQQPACEGVMMWDYADKWSWLHPNNGTYHWPAPFRSDLSVKPAYYGMQEALNEHTGLYRLVCRWEEPTGYFSRDSAAAWSGVHLQDLVPTWWSQQWHMERVSTGVYRIRCRWENSTGYLGRNAEGSNPGSTVAVGPVNVTWTSQQWQLERVAVGLYRIKCLWGPSNGYLSRTASTNPSSVWLGTLNTSWWSQQWYLDRTQ